MLKEVQLKIEEGQTVKITLKQLKAQDEYFGCEDGVIKFRQNELRKMKRKGVIKITRVDESIREVDISNAGGDLGGIEFKTIIVINV